MHATGRAGRITYYTIVSVMVIDEDRSTHLGKVIFNANITSPGHSMDSQRPKFFEEISFSEGIIFTNPNFTWEEIEKSVTLNNAHKLVHHPHITWQMLVEKGVPLGYILDKEGITWEILDKYCSQQPWYEGFSFYEGLAKNPQVLKLYQERPQSKWWSSVGHFLSQNRAITWEFVQLHPEIMWNYKDLSYHVNITWEEVRQDPEKWDQHGLLENPHLPPTSEILASNDTHVLSLLSRSPWISMRFIRTHPEIRWRRRYICLNPNLTWEDRDLVDSDSSFLAQNHFQKDWRLPIVKRYKRQAYQAYLRLFVSRLLPTPAPLYHLSIHFPELLEMIISVSF